MTVHVDMDKDGGLLTVEQPIGILDGKKSLARIGVSFHSIDRKFWPRGKLDEKFETLKIFFFLFLII